MASHVMATASWNGEPRASNHVTVTASRNGEPRDGHDEPKRQTHEAIATGRFDSIDRLFHKLRATSRRASAVRRNEGKFTNHSRYLICLYANIAAIRATARSARSHAGNRMPRRPRRPHRRADVMSEATPVNRCVPKRKSTDPHRVDGECGWEPLGYPYNQHCGAYAPKLYSRCCRFYAKAATRSAVPIPNLRLPR